MNTMEKEKLGQKKGEQEYHGVGIGGRLLMKHGGRGRPWQGSGIWPWSLGDERVSQAYIKGAKHSGRKNILEQSP